MKLAINKESLRVVPKFTTNIKDEWINPLIAETCELRFRDTISMDLYDAMATSVQGILNGTQGLNWNVTTAYAGGAIVLFNDMYYVALTSVTGGNTPPTNTAFVVYELVNFWSDFVKSYLSYETYKQYLLWAGKHIAMGGLRRHIDNTSTEISGDELGVLLGDIKSSVKIKLTKLMNKLNEVSYTFDGVVYNANEVKPKNKFGIYVV